VSEVVDYARSLPGVVHAEENLYTCSTDTQEGIIRAIDEHGLNRVVVASCTPRTHEPLFQETLCEGGLNKYLFEMANIRDQCSWVHASFPEEATDKAEDLVRMAVARAATLEPLRETSFQVNQKGLVIGGGLSGMTAALSLARQGFEIFLVERERELGGNLRGAYYTLTEEDIQGRLASIIEEVERHERIRVLRGAEILEFTGHVGKYRTKVKADGKEHDLEHGAVIVATGGAEYGPEEYSYGQSERVLTQRELEEAIGKGAFSASEVQNVVMIQCVGSREEGHMYCCRVGCSEAIKNALRLKELNPEANIFVLFRDMRTYAFNELYYQKARQAGIVFIRYELDRKPQVRAENNGFRVRVFDEAVKAEIEVPADYVILTASIRPHPSNEDLSTVLKVPLNPDGFYLEAHMKLRPLDFANEGMYLCGLAHSPKLMKECISQAQGAAARASTVLSKQFLSVGGAVAVVDQDRCVACLTCVRECPFGAPAITEEQVVFIEPASCQGCGMCASACPRKTIELKHYKEDQILAKCKAIG
jgi:heterodisulfide reductase subunit A-like polyferredoxin